MLHKQRLIPTALMHTSCVLHSLTSQVAISIRVWRFSLQTTCSASWPYQNNSYSCTLKSPCSDNLAACHVVKFYHLPHCIHIMYMYMHSIQCILLTHLTIPPNLYPAAEQCHQELTLTHTDHPWWNSHLSLAGQCNPHAVDPFEYHNYGLYHQQILFNKNKFRQI